MNLCLEGGVDKMKIWHAPPTPALGSYCWVLLLGRVIFFFWWGEGGGGEGERGGGGSQNFEGKFKIA